MNETNIASWSGLRQGLTGVERDGTKLLLVRDGASVRAFEGLCPHAEAPLDEGALCDGRIICPWHMGSFDARTGAWCEPVALRGLKSYPVRIEGDAVLVGTEPSPPPTAPETADTRRFVLVGTGAAAATAAATLRQNGFGGRLVMVGPDAAEPLDRTLLSKMALSDPEFDRGMLPLIDADELRIERKWAAVTALDAGARQLGLSDGSTLTYDAALLATGASPGTLDVPGAEHACLLRNLGDVDRILKKARPGARAVVIGTSFIGMEAASALTDRKLAVTVVGEEALPFAKQFGDRIAQALLRLHESKGVAFHLNSQVAGIAPDSVTLGSGATLDCDLVLVGVGVQPVLDYAGGLARGPQGGLLTDRGLYVKDGLWAAGDIAAPEGWPRIEHWRLAQQHGRVAAFGMLGMPAVYEGVPFFWTEQHGTILHYLGHAATWDEIVFDGDVEGFDFVTWYLQDDNVAAAAVCGNDHASAVLSQKLRERLSLAEARHLIAT